MSKLITSGFSVHKWVLILFVIMMGISYNSYAQVYTITHTSPPEQKTNFMSDILWDQTSPVPNPQEFVASQRNTNLNNATTQLADDFEVPPGETWVVEEIFATGVLGFFSPGPIPASEVTFYEDDNGRPGFPIASCTYKNLEGLEVFDGIAIANLTPELDPPCVLEEGIYWLQVTAVMDSVVNGRWGWGALGIQVLNEWQIQDIEGLITGFPPCTTWSPGDTVCGFNGLSRSFQILGTQVMRNITLEPLTATNRVRDIHTVTATIAPSGDPVSVEDILVSFEVTSGPNVGEASNPNSGECVPDDCRTDANGQVSWTYRGGDDAGTDTIIASFVEGIVMTSNEVEVIWVLVPRNVPTLSEWGLIATSALLLISALIYLRRRKALI